MYDLKVKSTFIHFRAQGMTIQKISEVMGVNRTTLIQWNKELYTDIKIAERDEFEKLLEANMCDRITRVRLLAQELGACYDKIEEREQRTDKLTLLKEIEKLTKLLNMEMEDKKYSSMVQKSSSTVNKDFPVIVDEPDKFREYDEMYEHEYESNFDWDEDFMVTYNEEEKAEALKQKAKYEAEVEKVNEKVRLEEEKELKQDSDKNCVVTPKADEKKSRRIINKKPDLQVLKGKKVKSKNNSEILKNNSEF